MSLFFYSHGNGGGGGKKGGQADAERFHALTIAALKKKDRLREGGKRCGEETFFFSGEGKKGRLDSSSSRSRRS